ncbi:DUF3362 domain-containing protein, partial [Pseudomonas aeruginosa]
MVLAIADQVSAPHPLQRLAQQRRLHKAFLRYHDPKGWPLLVALD